MTAKFTNTEKTSIEWIDANGVVWSGIRAKQVNGETVIEGDGQIPDQVKDWLEEGNTPTPYQPPEISIEEARATGIATMVAFADSITAQILSKYPEAEQRLWPKYEEEAKKFNMTNVSSNKVADFPALTGMLDAKFGPASATEQKARLKAAVPGIIANASNWLTIAQYVSGLRARVGAKIDIANSEEEINNILSDAKVEAEGIAKQMGLNV